MLDPGVLDFVRESLSPAPLRVLDVGAGRGELAAALVSAGYEVVAIDPASTGDPVRPIPLHDLPEPAESFDAAVAVVSLHHVEPLRESCRRLAQVVRPGGTLVLVEIDAAPFDERAARWWLEHRNAGEYEHGGDEHGGHEHGGHEHGGHEHGGHEHGGHEQAGHEPGTPEEIVDFLRHHIHDLATLEDTLGEWFELGPPVRGPYLYRWELPPGLRLTEEEDIAAGRLPAVGVRIVGTRRRRPA